MKEKRVVRLLTATEIVFKQYKIFEIDELVNQIVKNV